MTDTYENWVERLMAGRDGRPLEAEELITTAEPEPFSAVSFARVDRDKYVAEVGRKAEDFIYHFYPLKEVMQGFEDKMGDAILEVFKLEDRLEASFVPEFGSWAVRARGFAASSFGENLAVKVFDVLDKRLA